MTELAPDIHAIECSGVNAYLVDDDVPTLVDAGTPFDEDDIRDGIAKAGVALEDIKRVLLTHYDVDHVGTLAALAPELNATVRAGAFDADLLTGRRKPPLKNHKGLIQRVAGLLVTTPALEVRSIEDGEAVGSFEAYHTPGHTPGHVVYVSADLDTAMLGDLVTESDGGFEPSSWVMSYDAGDVEASVVDLAARAPEFEVAGVGHGEPLAVGGSDALRALADRLADN